ncbi:hypothetical protein DL766_007104 [Monosporascus sp. MC13-8B]|uniref:Urease accessory protein UreD n=1 Tax=Monosporascus cannonballus TaxID=155416 RepID=A0ABY0H9Q0_9PEZI|nr:hypothetical protein DL762_003961 [Monosporascus cannonballus]RYO94805.1 hypothetical protein DL763_003909 [Monosporascus cannonballus]RYP25299.1 hypothetical protein DL766_007104 [Monosporascus sp. MC13-8B]
MTSPFPKSSSSPGQGRIVVKLLPNNTSTFESVTYQYPLKLISPAVTADQKSVLVFLLSYGGGLVGGDQVGLSIDVQSGAKLSIVTQGHTKVFQSVTPDIITRQKLDIKIEADAGLCLLPDPVQPFERSVYEQIQIFKLAPRASLCLLDWVTQGRSARGEDWSFTRWTGRNEVWATSETAYAKPRLLVRDAVTLDGAAGRLEPQSLRESMHGHAIFGTLILRGPMTRSIGEFFLSEFKALPRIGARDFEENSRVLSELESWRAGRLKAEKELKILWSAAHVRGCTIVKFGAATVEAGRNWIGSMLLREGTCEKSFGEQALMGAWGARATRGGSGRGAAAGPVATATPSGEGSSQDDAPAASATGRDGGGVPEVISVSSTPTPSVQDGPSSGQSAPPSAPSRGGGTRFKPKNVRRDAAERQRLEQERNRDLASKIKQEEREQRAEDRRARRGRGRGGAMSQRGFIRRTVTATGPFSAIPAENVKSGKGGWGWSAGPSRLHNIPHVASTRYRPRREHETRVNIDVLSGFAEDVEDPETHFETFRSGQKSGSLPMGLFRTEHQEEEVKVATTAELQAEEQQSEDEGDLFVDPLPTKDAQGVDIDMNDNEVWHAAPASAIKVKAEPGTEAADVDMSDIPEAPGVKAPPSPEQKKKPAVGGGDGVAKEKEKRREKALQDPEVQHAVLDAQTLLKELRVYKEGDEQSGRDKDGRMYLFQLPPILPPLAKPSPDGGVQEAPIDVDSQHDEAPKVKREDGAAGPLPEGGGYIGRLNVRRSGKVELDWGGTTLTLGNGTETEFLTTAVMLETREHPDNPEALTGVGYGMGQVMGKFVLTPVWDEEEDWEPSLEGLRLSDTHDGDRNRDVHGGAGGGAA